MKGGAKMSFSSMMEILQERNKGKIVLIKLGAFYVATEKDAVFLHDSTKYSYIIFDYDKQNRELKEIHSKIGKQHKITSKNINCLECKGVSAYKDDEYMEAIYKLMDQERANGE